MTTKEEILHWLRQIEVKVKDNCAADWDSLYTIFTDWLLERGLGKEAAAIKWLADNRRYPRGSADHTYWWYSAHSEGYQAENVIDNEIRIKIGAVGNPKNGRSIDFKSPAEAIFAFMGAFEVDEKQEKAKEKTANFPQTEW